MMKQTETYKLNLIDRDDPFSPEALNANAQTLEKELARVNAALAERPRMVTGTYTGTGTRGVDKPSKLDFADTLGCAPKLLIIGDTGHMHLLVMVNGAQSTSSYPSTTTDYRCYLTWTETGVEWYNGTSARGQMNETRDYYYVAFA